MKTTDDYDSLSPREKKEYQLNSQEMNSFYTLPLDERQAVLDRVSGWSSRRKGSASIRES
jgi:hypothetical protein